MAAEIALQANDDRGREIVDELEKQTEVKPTEVMDAGTRYLSAMAAGVDAFDQMLDKIDLDWRSHLTNLAGQRGD